MSISPRCKSGVKAQVSRCGIKFAIPRCAGESKPALRAESKPRRAARGIKLSAARGIKRGVNVSRCARNQSTHCARSLSPALRAESKSALRAESKPALRGNKSYGPPGGYFSAVLRPAFLWPSRVVAALKLWTQSTIGCLAKRWTRGGAVRATS